MSLTTYHVTEKCAVMFLNQMLYAKSLSRARYDELVENYRVKKDFVFVKGTGKWIDFANRLMMFLRRQFGEMEVCSPGALCFGRMYNRTQEICSVCHEDVCENTIIARMSCAHIFHEYCLLGWMKSGQTMANYCPKCRTIIDDGRPMLVHVCDNTVY